MSLAQDMQIAAQACDFCNPFEVERGGILSLTTLSGIQYAVYEPNPTDSTVVIGLMLHDQEEVNLWRGIAPWNSHRAYPAFTYYPYAILGEFITNATHPAIDPNQIFPGAPCYLAPSGLITCSPSYKTKKIGKFLSYLNDSSLKVPGTLGASSMRLAGNNSIINPQAAIIPTAGWIKIRLDIS